MIKSASVRDKQKQAYVLKILFYSNYARHDDQYGVENGIFRNAVVQNQFNDTGFINGFNQR